MRLTFSYGIQMLFSHMPTCHYFLGNMNANKWHLFIDIYFDIAADNLTLVIALIFLAAI